MPVITEAPTTEATTYIPQANNLDAVVAVVDAIAAGMMTSGEIAEAIGMSDRQGGYYPHAAATLGFVEANHSTVPVIWELTVSGHHLAGLSAEERVGEVLEAVLECPLMDEYVSTGGPERMAEEWAAAGLSDETIARRLATLASWTKFITSDAESQRAKIAQTRDMACRRAPEIIARRKAAQAPPARFCNLCGTKIPAALEECELC